jgi:hypothetical protein
MLLRYNFIEGVYLFYLLIPIYKTDIQSYVMRLPKIYSVLYFKSHKDTKIEDTLK